MREFQNVSLLENPNIIKPFDLYINKKTEYIHYVMELVKHRSLNHYSFKGPIPEQKVIKLLQKLLSTVEYMHSKGVAHRDITSKNVLISPDFEEMKLIDFGVSKQFAHFSFKAGIHLKKSMRMFTFTGVYQYLAPEILKGEGYSTAVDIWSIGILTYELLSASKPYKSEYISDLLEEILVGDLQFSEKPWKSLSNLSKDFIKRLLKTDPKMRLTAKQALNHPWLFLPANRKISGTNEISLINIRKPSILTISAFKNRIPSIDDIEINLKTPGFSRFKDKFKEKMTIRGLDLHVHTIEIQPFRAFSMKYKGKSGVVEVELAMGLGKKKFKTGKSLESDNEEEKEEFKN